MNNRVLSSRRAGKVHVMNQGMAGLGRLGLSAERAMLPNGCRCLLARAFAVLCLPELAFRAILLLHQLLLFCFCCLRSPASLLPSRFFLYLPVRFVDRLLGSARCQIFLALDIADVNTRPDYRGHDDAYPKDYETEGGIIFTVCFFASNSLPIVH